MSSRTKILRRSCCNRSIRQRARPRTQPVRMHYNDVDSGLSQQIPCRLAYRFHVKVGAAGQLVTEPDCAQNSSVCIITCQFSLVPTVSMSSRTKNPRQRWYNRSTRHGTQPRTEPVRIHYNDVDSGLSQRIPCRLAYRFHIKVGAASQLVTEPDRALTPSL